MLSLNLFIESLEPRELLAADFAAADLNTDNRLNDEDIDSLVFAIAAQSEESRFDVNGDGKVTPSDLDYLVGDLFGTVYGHRP